MVERDVRRAGSATAPTRSTASWCGARPRGCSASSGRSLGRRRAAGQNGLALGRVVAAAPAAAASPPSPALGAAGLARPERPRRSPRGPRRARARPANSTTIARIGRLSVHAPCTTPAGHSTASPAATRACSSPTRDAPAALDHDEPRRVRVAVRLDRGRRARTRAPRSRPVGRRMDDLALRSRDPAGPSAPPVADPEPRDLHRRGASAGACAGRQRRRRRRTSGVRIVLSGCANFVREK